MSFRIEKDSIGKIKVPSKAYYGAQTQRAVENFQIGWPMEFSLILPYIIIKKCAARTNYAQKNISKTKICELYSSSSIAIVSSLYEGFGYPVIEAMSCEVPLIATDVSSIPELVGDFAKLIKPKDSKQISDAVIEILSDYENYKVIAENGRQHIIDKFNWPTITRQYEEVILKTIQNYKNVNF